MSESDREISTERTLVALVALAAADRDERVGAAGTGRRSELVLADAGLTIAEITQLTGRKYEAVKTAIRRARGRDKSMTTTASKGPSNGE